MILRRAEDRDLEEIVSLNNIESKWVGAKEKSFFEPYIELPHFYVAEEENKIVGFMLCVAPEIDFASLNFKWFRERLDDFIYIDRLVVKPEKRKQGVGTALHKELQSKRGKAPIVGEISINPRNDESIKYHEKMGFKSMGTFSAYEHTCNMYRWG